MSKTLQQQLASGITSKFKDAIVKKIDKDNYLDIHLPSVHPKKGTHLGINTAKGEIKIVFYCREDDFNNLALNNSKKIEDYAQGLRIKGNPRFDDASKAIDAAIDFVLELMRVTGNSSKGISPGSKSKNAVPEKEISPKKESHQITEKSKISDYQLAIEAYGKGEFEKVIDYFENGGNSFLIKKGNSKIYIYLEKELDSDGNPRLIKLMEVPQSEANNPPDGTVYKSMQISRTNNSALKKNSLESDFKQMIKAYKEGDFDKVGKFIEKGNPVLQFNEDGSIIENELITVCVADPVDIELLNKIIKRGDDLNEQNNDLDRYTAVHYCAWDGKSKALSIILKNGALPDMVGEDGRSALHLAAANGFSESVELLLKAGVDIDRRIPNDDSFHYSKYGSTALREAVYNQFWDVIDLLIENGADLKSLREPCIGSIQGKNDLFDVIRLMEKAGEYAEGKFNRKRLDELEILVKGKDHNSENEEFEQVIDDQEDKDRENVLGNSEQTELSEFDIDDVNVIKYICDKIKHEKYLTNLIYVNKELDAKGYSVDNHQAYFFDSNVLVSDNELEGFLVVNMDGFYSNCVNEDEMQMIFSWNGVNNIEYDEDGDDTSIDIVSDQGRLTIKKEGSNSLKILYTFYKYVWKNINDKFKDEPIIVWNDVWKTGIKPVNFYEFINYYTFDVSQEDEEVVDTEEDDEIDDVSTGEPFDEENEENTETDEEIAPFYIGQSYERQYIRFQEIADKTGILSNKIKIEPTSKERDELWEIVRVFANRIYQIDNDKSPNKDELNTLCFYSIVSLHWCDLMINDKRFSMNNGRFRRDVIALALCFYARIDRKYDYYDYVKSNFILPHMKFSVLLWSINSIVNLGQDNLFGLFSQEQALKAQKLFTEMDKKNQAKGLHGVLALNEMPDNHPLSLIWKELFTLFRNVRIPYQFIRNYISLEFPKRSFLRGLISGKSNNDSGVNVTLLDEDKKRNISFLDNQIIHKQFPTDWSFLHDMAFVSIYFAQKTDNFLSDSEMSVIYKLLEEWISDKDEQIIKNRVKDAYIKANAEFEKDMSKDRFEFALENIRRNIFVNCEYDLEKTQDQLKIILNDLLSIAEADDEVKIEEVDLINVIKNEWRVNLNNYKDYNDGEYNQETENDDEYESDDDKQLTEILHKCGVESIDDLTTLTPDQSKKLASYTGPYLNFSALTALTEKNAEILAKYNGCLMLDRLVSISDKAVEYLSNHSGGFISLDGVTSLSDKAIAAISKHDGAIYLNGLTYLSDNACIALSKHKDALLLNGVTKISEKGAIAISKHEGELSMDGLISLSVKAAKALAIKGISVKEDDN